eukprot:scaffold202459_cov32-Tisochrysis_lutea.AAC.1
MWLPAPGKTIGSSPWARSRERWEEGSASSEATNVRGRTSYVPSSGTAAQRAADCTAGERDLGSLDTTAARSKKSGGDCGQLGLDLPPRILEEHR